MSITGAGEITCVAQTTAASGTLFPPVLLTPSVSSAKSALMLHMQVDGDAEWSAFGDALTLSQKTLLDDPTEWKPDIPAHGSAMQDDDAPILALLAEDGRAGATEIARRVNWSTSLTALTEIPQFCSPIFPGSRG